MKDENYQKIITLAFNKSREDEMNVFEELMDYCNKYKINRNLLIKSMISEGLEKLKVHHPHA